MVRKEKSGAVGFVSSGKGHREGHCQWLDLNEIGFVKVRCSGECDNAHQRTIVQSLHRHVDGLQNGPRVETPKVNPAPSGPLQLACRSVEPAFRATDWLVSGPSLFRLSYSFGSSSFDCFGASHHENFQFGQAEWFRQKLFHAEP